jgi:acyl dehydratase
MTDEPRKSDAGKSRAEPGEVARDAVAEIGEAVTHVAHAAGSVLDAIGEAAGDALSGLVARRRSGAPASAVVPELTPLHPVQAGDEVKTRVRLANGTDSATEAFALTATDLVSDTGDRIAAGAVSLSDDKRVVAANATDTVQVRVNVPADAKPGVYTGEVRPSDGSVAPAPIVIEVR